MRSGSVFRRCRCGATVPDKTCPRCGARGSFTWAYVVDLAPPGEKRQQHRGSGFKSKAEANAAMAKLQTDKADGRHVDPDQQTIAQYLDAWVAGGCVNRKGQRPRASTRTAYEVAVRRHLIPHIGSRRLQRLTRGDVLTMYGKLLESGHRNGGPLSPKSVHNTQVCLHGALEVAMRAGLIRTNPADDAFGYSEADRPEMPVWTREQLSSFMARIDGDRLAALWRLVAATGLRRGEALGLRWSDVDFARGTISIRQALSLGDEGWFFGPPKTRHGRRTIAVGDPLALAALRQHRTAQQLAMLPGVEALLVFCRPDGRHLDANETGKVFNRVVAQLGLSEIGLHGLRHTHASIWLADGKGVFRLSRRLGHHSASFTMDRYGHLLPDEEGAAVNVGDEEVL